MSGTSLDGLDLALCEFESERQGYAFRILQAHTVEYAPALKKELASAMGLSAEAYFRLHASYGRFLAEEAAAFLKGSDGLPTAIASHGHTVFHQPQLGFSTQLGCGATIAAATGITTVCDFRSLDVAMGGQGAPLVPLGDKLLFGNYQACLNLGGIANISFDDVEGNRRAYDVCEANMLLNHLSQKAGQAYDKNGDLARSGTAHSILLQALNRLEYYLKTGAKSIGREWFEQEVLPLVEGLKINVNDLLATATEHVADILALELNEKKVGSVLVTGGGAFNSYLIEKLRSKTTAEIIIPEPLIVNFKEALIFAFLGYLRLQQKTNTLNSVTGATADSIGGAIYSGKC